MPTVLANAVLSFVPDRSLSVRGPDRVGVVSPMFNEATGARAALGSLLAQTEPFDELVVSINGGTDDTLGVVRAVMQEHGFTRVYAAPAPDFQGRIERWHRPGGPAVALLEHAQPISKAHSINVAVEGHYLTSDRVLVVDGDTIFAPTFLEKLKDDFYRLRRKKDGEGWFYQLEDNAIQSGAVTSLAPGRGQPLGTHISRARSAEYAVATLLRAGQTARVGGSALFGQSRLYTVVGCGFAARRTSFPMPSDTLTEDHDFTLQVQNEAVTERPIGRSELQERGFKVVTAAGEVAAADYFLPDDRIVLRRGGTARFVPGALMYTEDPLNVPGYMRQVERWNGGGLENTVKRLRRTAGAIKPNVAFATLAAQFENLFGLALLLLILPVALGVNSALPGYGTALAGLGAWLSFDLLATLLLVGFGFRRLWRAQGERGWRLARSVTSSTLRSSVPLLTLRLFNAVAYVVALTRVVPGALRAKEVDPSVTITWERPRAVAKRQLGVRATTVVLSVLLGNVTLFAGAYYLADTARPGYRDTWLMINSHPPVNTAEHVTLPLLSFVSLVEPPPTPLEADSLGALHEPHVTQPAPRSGDEPTPLGVGALTDDHERSTGRLSAYCSVGSTSAPARQRLLLAGEADAYQPLTYWQRLVLARLVPVAANLEEAATAYDVSPDLLLRVLINESYLDPLAVGPTNDLGLSQVTGDALTLLREISTRPDSPFANARLFAGTFNVFDPDFSICAGAAKLAWASAQPGGDDERYAYARYINPLEGVQRSGLNPVHAELVVAIQELVPLSEALRNAFAAYQHDQLSVTDQERALFGVYDMVADGQLNQRAAYLAVHSLVRSFGIDDGDFYEDITDRLYGESSNTVALPAFY